MHKQDLVIPIRTRGTLAGAAPGRASASNVLTARTRGKAAVEEGLPSLELVMADLRLAVREIPLTTVIHGWGGAAAGQFLRALMGNLVLEDRVWLVPFGAATDSKAIPGLEGALMLDLSKSIHKQVYQNLVWDLAFFSATDEAEVAAVRTWKDPAQVVIISKGQPLTKPLEQATSRAKRMYGWLEDKLTKDL